MNYTVENVYGIAGESNHRKVEAALKAATKREGDGWIVIDDEGNQWDWNGDQPAITKYAHERE